MRLFDLSLRHKLPLWGGFLILVTALVVSGGYMLQTRESLKQNMLARSEVLGRTLVRTLYAAVTQDDVWRAYETISALQRAETRRPSFQIEHFIVFDRNNDVFASTDPELFPLQVKLDTLGPDFSQLQSRLRDTAGSTVVLEAEKILLAIPLVAEGVTLGTLVLVHPADYYFPSYSRIFKRTAWTTVIVLLFLLPISWYWGRRMTAPLVLLAERMGDVGSRPAETLPHHLYPHRDELGRLFQAFDRMLGELAEKEDMKQEMIKSDRLAALGRLSAGIAHEINNPLGGC